MADGGTGPGSDGQGIGARVRRGAAFSGGEWAQH